MSHRVLISSRYAAMPSCAGKMPLGIAVAQLASFSCDIDPDEIEIAVAKKDAVLKTTFRWLLDRFQTGELMAWSRPLGGGLPQHVSVGYWQIDDPAPRFISSQINIEAPFDGNAPPDSWLFIDEEDYVTLWNSFVAAAERAENMRQALPRLRSQEVTRGPQLSHSEIPGDEKFLSLDEVMAKVRLSRGAIYARIAGQKFPKPIKVGRASRWLHSELDRWLADFRSA